MLHRDQLEMRSMCFVHMRCDVLCMRVLTCYPTPLFSTVTITGNNSHSLGSMNPCHHSVNTMCEHDASLGVGEQQERQEQDQDQGIADVGCG